MSEDSPSNPSAGTSSSSPSPGKHKREGNDSLWKRARRTLGTSSLTFLQPQNKASRANKSGASGPAEPSKRREQVRQAQRTHRQRTQNYIKTLESEVVRLRGSEDNLIQEKENLQGKLEILRTTCQLSGIPLPDGIDQTHKALSQRTISINPTVPATVSLHQDSMSNQRLHVQWPSPPTIHGNPQPAHSQAAFNNDQTQTFHSAYSDSPYVPSPPNNLDFHSLDLNGVSQASSTTGNPSLDTPDVAIDFVLALEHPCMTHIPHPTTTTQDPSNHILLASTPLMSRAPSPPQADSSWTASAAMITELLNLSSNINLQGELTPVEAWHQLRQHPYFWTLDHGSIEQLKSELSQIVTCCGFGAVLDENLFWLALNRIIGAGQNQYI